MTQSTRRGSRSRASSTRLTRALRANSCSCADSCLSRWTSVAPPGAQGRRRVQEGQAEIAAGVLAPVRDDDRGRRQRRRGARHARGADGRQVPGRGDRRRPLRDRGRRHPLEGARAASEGLQPAVRRHGRGRRVVGNARHRARPRRRPDREGDADQATGQVGDGLPGGRDHVRVASCSRSCSSSSSRSSWRSSTS